MEIILYFIVGFILSLFITKHEGAGVGFVTLFLWWLVIPILLLIEFYTWWERKEK